METFRHDGSEPSPEVGVITLARPPEIVICEDVPADAPAHIHHLHELRIFSSPGKERLVTRIEVIFPGVRHCSVPIAVARDLTILQLRGGVPGEEAAGMVIRQLEIFRDAVAARAERELLRELSCCVLLLLKRFLSGGGCRRRGVPAAVTVRAAAGYIEANYSRPELSVREVAGFVGVDASYLLRCFRSALNLSVRRFIVITRLHRACELLEYGGYPVAEVAIRTGWRSPGYFIGVFRRCYHLTPGTYARSFRRVAGAERFRLREELLQADFFTPRPAAGTGEEVRSGDAT